MQHKFSPSLTVSALVSIGAHPDSGRARRAATDARAVELALNLENSDLEVVHAGDPLNPALREYSGMGLSQLRVIAQEGSADAIDTLTSYFTDNMPDIILTGSRAESGESSGLLPFFLARRLACPLVTGIADILNIDDNHADVLQALPRGQRRALRVPLPFVATVDHAAQAPRQSAFGVARRTQIDTTKTESTTLDGERMSWEETPAKAKAKRLKVVKAKTAADRFKAATAKTAASGGKVMKEQPVSEMAQAVFDLLLEEGVIR
ncbi:electron transfer flavoprotein subunit beta [Vibrio fluvialis]|jgi:electron transfer flavoprotein beta subunit|uniref:electron transfer flavoprotein subunit beta n=1 Tax=Vibrio fluvialis TaxID=676 RepID=UPI00192BA9A4|nr:electron transfer flavoprotein subunit beta [Vibrio fluvialis]MBL4295741.1 electron transfer flavoprotein subunit beta [Vibrio fluvialis]MBY8036176.1 electron transfer flavoprotein subunit beta [Vibrio fluvialis]MBY8040147.1 electron transfer flavoprotein subunit beta [Vibrio fluvialis]MBY8193968.1 electron transfer flavoprotein subunit beta [Vibrio fluvialis]WDY54094.1 electron transfer flavoprotein subunit beta [Vibrio fluvialis]